MVSKLSKSVGTSHKWHLSASRHLMITLQMKVLVHHKATEFKACLSAWSWWPWVFAAQKLKTGHKN